MTTIDHRILIPANPQVVWDYLSNLSRNPKWQVDCRSVTFLTHKHDGPGTRWRSTTDNERDFVLEITAWYNGLGYEYVYIEGPGFEENIGRIRLQEIPEGTIVQWTFTYELPGVFGGLRNALGTRRQLDKLIADSLRKLYLQIKAQSAAIPIEAKSLMRDAPNAEARSQYQPRHPSPVKEVPSPDAVPTIEEPPISADDAQTLEPLTPPPAAIPEPPPAPVVIAEPPPVDDDTRPNPVIKRDTGEIPVGEEPEFLERLPAKKFSTGELEAIPPNAEPGFDFGGTEEAFPPVTSSAPVIISEPPIDPVFDTQPRGATVPTATETPPVVESASVDDEPSSGDLVPITPIRELSPAEPRDTLPPLPEPEPPPALATPPLPPWEEPTISPNATVAQPTTLDTANISIWEIFGVQRPSETQQIKAYVEPPPEPSKQSMRPDMTPPRMGLRTALRRQRKSKAIRRIKLVE